MKDGKYYWLEYVIRWKVTKRELFHESERSKRKASGVDRIGVGTRWSEATKAEVEAWEEENE